jgi:hypothetical protein
MRQAKSSIPLSGRMSRQFAPDFEISRAAPDTYPRRPRKIERRGKITRQHAVGMDDFMEAACWAMPLTSTTPQA